jgi:diguanylate cyclase (GGDEF)-like protein
MATVLNAELSGKPYDLSGGRHLHLTARPKLAALLLSMAMVGLAAAALFGVLDVQRPQAGLDVPWAALALMFLMTELFVVQVESKRGPQTFSLSEFPLVLGLFFLNPMGLLVARLVGSAAALGVRRRAGLLKLVLTLSMLALEVGLVSVVFRAMAGPRLPSEPRAWAAGFAAMLAAGLVRTFVGGTAARLDQAGVAARRVAQSFSGGTLVSIFANTSLALLAVDILTYDMRSGWLLLGVAIVVALAYRGYASLRERHARLGLLYEFIGVAGRSMKIGSMVRAMLSQARELLRTERDEITLVSEGHQALRISLGAEGRLSVDQVPSLDPEGMRALVMRSRQARLVSRNSKDQGLRSQLGAEGMSDVAIAPLVSEGSVVGTMLVADRPSEVGSFDVDDLQLFEALTNHVSVALQNGRLVEQLRQEAAAKEHQALHDALTGLPNRALFHSRVVKALARAERTGSLAAVMLIDLDRFKEVNDTLGHHHGDLLLEAVSGRLKRALKDEDTIARLGGDEFAVLLPDVADTAAVAHVAERLVRTLFEPFQLGELTLDVGASIGIAIYPTNGTEAATLLQRADVAMYSAKTACTPYEFYSADSDHHSPTRLALVGELRMAIENGELTVHYQPKADVRTGAITGVEALLRWEHPQHGPVPPDEFVAIAEQTGAIRSLTLHVLRSALGQCATWREQGLDLSVAVNLSVRSLLDADLTRDVEQVLRETNVPPSALILEITEGSMMADSNRTLSVLRCLSSMGVSLSIDDFGTGYSSLSYLKRLPVSEVKIDKSFVMNMATDDNDDVIVRSTIDLGHNLGLRVVAEGVENQASWDRLVALGCDVAQGYYLSAPLCASAMDEYLERAIGAGSQFSLHTRELAESASGERITADFPGDLLSAALVSAN